MAHWSRYEVPQDISHFHLAGRCARQAPVRGIYQFLHGACRYTCAQGGDDALSEALSLKNAFEYPTVPVHLLIDNSSC